MSVDSRRFADSYEPTVSSETHRFVDDEVAAAVEAGVELWRPMENFVGRYEASTMGRIRSVSRFVPCRYRPRNITGRVVAQQNSHYLTVTLFNGQRLKRYAVHRIIAQTFVSNPDEKPTVNHINGRRHDNRVSNLEWATRTEQNLHSRRVLKKCVGEHSAHAKLTQNDVYEIRALRAFGAKIIDLAAAYGVERQAVRNILLGRTWRIEPA